VAKREQKEPAKPAQALEIMRQCPALLEREVDSLTDKQKQIADARVMLVQEVEKLRDAGMSRVGAVRLISDGSRDGTLPERLTPVAVIANARKGDRSGISVRTLQGWITVYETTRPGLERLALLAPGHKKETAPEDVGWFYSLFAPHYRNQQGPTLRKAYREFKAEWLTLYADQAAMLAALPSYDAVRRLLKKLPLREQVRGRVTGSAAKPS
jgi:putative transposase